MIQPPAGANIVTYTFTRPADSLDDHYRIEHGDDLADWTGIASIPFVTSSLIQPDGSEDVILTVPLDHPDFTPPRHFIRLKVIRP
jgi:hypothetical protein